jgi:hypothetical protein
MPLLGQSSGGFTESSSALRLLHAGIRNTVGVLTSDSFTQTNPPIVTTTTTVSSQVDSTKRGVLSGSVAFSRPDAGGGSNFIGGPASVVATTGCLPLGCFINSANGNPYENTPGPASGKGPYMSSMGTYGNALFETRVLTGASAGVALTYAVGNLLAASRNGYLTNVSGGATNAEQCYEGASPTTIGVLKMPADAVQGELVYDQRI